MDPIDRRSFLRHAATLGVGAVAWACAKPKRKTPEASSGSNALSVVVTAPILAKGDTRQAFALFRGERAVAPTDVTAKVSASDGSPVDVTVLRQSVRRGSGGSETAGTQTLEIYTFRHAFTQGIYLVDVTVGKEHPQPAAFQVAPDAPEPLVGGRAIASESPTTDDHRGVDPICTRTPVCSMHAVTIADALQKGLPTIITFATPAYCVSRTCGPTVDTVETVAKEFAGKVTFIHIEPFRSADAGAKALALESQGKASSDTSGDSPTFHGWKLGTEPWTYFVGADSVIKDRFMGSIGEDEVRSAVKDLVKG
jgi:hypothetical protein